MKKLICLIVVMLFMIPGVVFAGEFLDYVNDEVIAKLDLKQGVAYSVIDKKINYLSTAKVAEKGDFALEIGYAGSRNNTGHKIVGVASYDVMELKEYIDIPVLDLIKIRLGVYGGYGRLTGSNEWDAGVSATLFEIPWGADE